VTGGRNRLEDGQVHDGRWQDLGSYTVYRGGVLRPSQDDMTGRKVIHGKPIVFGKVGGERVLAEN